ncbi:ABC transporter permease [Pseudarthrobacter sulfonivorans]|uniref:ABC transporter permease n=1 Tax=Pseudarthrobacter sulfonivorans TaxID=121292 RepID=UPI00168A8BED|nr:ABC transporter permease [Pseudarthrobacter sulfonivorans]
MTDVVQRNPIQRDLMPEPTSKVIRPAAAELNPQQYRRRRRWTETGLAWVAPIVFLASWEIAAQSGSIDRAYFPAPSRVLAKAAQLATEGVLWSNLSVSLQRVLFGFIMGVIAGTIIGMVMGLSRLVRAALDGVLTAMYMIPKLAIFPILLLIFGLGETPKVLMIGITIFFFTWLQTMAAFSTTPRGFQEAARSFGASRFQRIWHVELPSALPAMFVALRLNIGVAMLMVVSIEFVSAREGIGWLIWSSWSLLATAQMYAGIITVSVTGVMLTLSVKLLGKWLVPWAADKTGQAATPF